MGADYPVANNRLTARFWLVAAVALLAASGTMRLGFWQLSRAAEKQALQQAIDERAKQAPLDNASLAAAAEMPATERIYLPVSLRGRWLDRYTVYLDNRQMDGKQGFFVLTPLQLDGAPQLVVMVQRGWVQRNFNDRGALPALPRADAMVRVDGRIAPPPAKLYEFESQAQGNIRQNLDLAGFALENGLPLASYAVLQTGPDGDGLARDWTPINTGVEKHHGYAFQWFALSGLVIFLFVWFQIVRRFFPSR